MLVDLNVHRLSARQVTFGATRSVFPRNCSTHCHISMQLQHSLPQFKLTCRCVNLLPDLGK